MIKYSLFALSIGLGLLPLRTGAATTIFFEDAKCLSDLKSACISDAGKWDQNLCASFGAVSYDSKCLFTYKQKDLHEYCVAVTRAHPSCNREVKFADEADLQKMMEEFRKQSDERLRKIVESLKESGAIAPPVNVSPAPVVAPGG
ncbi:MAG: hypothetical protein V4607_09670 [Pseudomonadota bacterium]